MTKTRLLLDFPDHVTVNFPDHVAHFHQNRFSMSRSNSIFIMLLHVLISCYHYVLHVVATSCTFLFLTFMNPFAFILSQFQFRHHLVSIKADLHRTCPTYPFSCKPVHTLLIALDFKTLSSYTKGLLKPFRL